MGLSTLPALKRGDILGFFHVAEKWSKKPNHEELGRSLYCACCNRSGHEARKLSYQTTCNSMAWETALVNCMCCIYVLQELAKQSIIAIIAVLFISLVSVASGLPFSNDMYHTPDPSRFPTMLAEHGYQVRDLEDEQTKQTALADLMPWPCDEESQMQIHEMRDFGRVAVKIRTYTEARFSAGRYYLTAGAYDRACICPPVYKVEWKPFHGKHKIFSSELGGGHVEVETTSIAAALRHTYVLFLMSSQRWNIELVVRQCS